MILLAYSQDFPSSNHDDNNDDDNDDDDDDDYDYDDYDDYDDNDDDYDYDDYDDYDDDDDTVLKSLTDSIVNLARYLLHLMLSYGVMSYDLGSKQ